MKNRSKKFVVGIVLLAIGVIGLFGLFTDTDEKGALLGGSVLFIVAGAALIFLDSKKKPASVETPKRNIYAERAEAMKNNEYYDFRVAGVTYNTGHKSRQVMLRKIYFGDEPFDGLVEWTLEKYDFEGSPAVGVYANGEQVGNVPKDNLAFVLTNFDRIKSVYHAEVTGGGETDDGKKINFGCKITLCLSK